MLALGAARVLRRPFAASLRRPPFASAVCHRSSSGGGDPGWYQQAAHSAPVRLAEDFLVEIQQSGAVPWWLAIGAATLGVRTLVTLPLAVYQTRILAKIEGLRPEITALAERLKYEVSMRAAQRGWTDKQCRFHFRKNLRRLMSELYVRDNCHPFKASVLVWVQLPLWISLSLALRNLSVQPSEHQPSLATGGALWFPDLTLPDATWLLPISLGLTNLLIVELFARQMTTVSSVQKWVSNVMRGISILMIPIAANVPSSMVLYWLISSLVGLSHNLLLRAPAVRKVLRFPKHHPDSPPDQAGRKHGE
nr:cytochrome c oxidase assembly protein COX18, mitochondrial-like [Nerophis lumbriciformis]